MKRLVLLLLCLFVTPITTASARRIVRPQPMPPRPPVLIVQVDGKAKPLKVSAVKVDVKIHGHLAETRMTTTFYNPHRRALEGDLYFPLPQGATVSGYALDIKGVMVDGVVVTKKRARQVFESEVRRGIDPGIVEWTKGNNFKTRVFPIPARGTRTVMVRYVSDLVTQRGQSLYQLPLAFKKKLPSFHLRVEAVKVPSRPLIVQGGPRHFKFKSWRESFLAETTRKNIRMNKNLLIAVPNLEKRPIQVERGPDGVNVFTIRDTSPMGAASPQVAQLPKRVTVIWDASRSRDDASRATERKLLARYLTTLAKTRAQVKLHFFRDRLAAGQTYTMPGQRSQLLSAIDKVAYDGGTQIGSIGEALRDLSAEQVLLFTDGISNFGRENPGKLGAPIVVVNASTSANHAFLRYLALKSSGVYLNLATRDLQAALKQIQYKPLSFIKATVVDGKASEVYPRLPEPVSGPFAIAGQLDSPRATIRLDYGIGGKVTHSRTFQVSADGAGKGDLLKRYWAQKKLADLLVFPKRNAEKIVALGKTYGVVTPGTSLIVLESLEQYVRHGIRPPAMLKEMRVAWQKAMAQRDADARKTKVSKLDRLLKLWSKRVMWWNKTFKYPKNFRYFGGSSKKSRLGSVRTRSRSPRPRVVVRPPSRRVVVRPRPTPRPTARGGDGFADRGGAADQKKDKKPGARRRQVAAKIALKPWNPNTPYLKVLRAAPKERVFAVYLAQRKTHGASPAFFLDVANFYLKRQEAALAIQVLSNIAELELENPALVRVLAQRLLQLERYDLSIGLLRTAKRLRPEEPQSFRDLGLALERRGDQALKAGKKQAAKRDYIEAMTLLAKVAMNRWARFREIELMALTELNTILPKARRLGYQENPVDKRLLKTLDMDVRIVMSWDADLTDMDLHVVEPSNEKAYYAHNRTTIGGAVSRDFTRGYGPEVYLLRRAMKGKYTIKTKYYGSRAAKLLGAVTLTVDIYTNYGRANQKRKSLTFRLTKRKEMFIVGQIAL